MKNIEKTAIYSEITNKNHCNKDERRSVIERIQRL